METRIENLLELGVDGGRKKTTSSCLHLLGPRIPGNPKFPNFCLIIHKSPSEQGNRSFYTRYKIPIELNLNLGNASMQQRNVRVLFSLWSHGRKRGSVPEALVAAKDLSDSSSRAVEESDHMASGSPPKRQRNNQFQKCQRSSSSSSSRPTQWPDTDAVI